MIRSYRYRLYPTSDQAVRMMAWLDQCRLLYNAALEQRISAYRRQKKSLTRFDQYKDLTVLRAGDSVFSGTSVAAQRSALSRLDLAYKAFFRRCKAGQKPGFPRFRGKGSYDTFSLGKPGIRITDNRVSIPKIGSVKLNHYRPLGGPIRDTHVRFDGRKWWISFACDLGEAPSKVEIRSGTGIDVGLTTYITLSDGQQIPNPRFFRVAEALLARRHKVLARRRRGSASRSRARQLVAKAHEHIRNQRLDFSRKLVAFLFNSYDCVSYEKLNIHGMIQGPLAKSVSDAAWGIFIGCLNDKAESAGRTTIEVDPRGTTSDCSRCGERVPKGLSIRIHDCPHCGLVLDRDRNAALNILARGQRALEARSCAVESEA